MNRRTDTKHPSPKKSKTRRTLAVDGPRDDFLSMSPEKQNSLVLEDYKAAYRLLESGALDQLSGQFVAVLEGRLVGNGRNSMALRTKTSRDYKVDPERVAIIHVFDEVVI
jgi:hypothetical protein